MADLNLDELKSKIYDTSEVAEVSSTRIEPEVLERAKKEFLEELREDLTFYAKDLYREWEVRSQRFCNTHKATNYKRENNNKDVEFDSYAVINEGMIIKCKDGDYWFDK